MAISTQAIKVALLVTLLVTTFALCMLPLLLSRYTRRATASRARRRCVKAGLSLMSCFAAGVFLATCLLDLFPDAHDKLDAALVREEIYTAYPVTEFLVVLGFLMVFLIEQIILTKKESSLGSEINPLLFHDSVDSLSQSYQSTGGHAHTRPNGPSSNHHQSYPVLYEPLNGDHNADSDAESGPPKEDDGIEECQNEVHADPGSHSVIRSLMLVMALSLHSVFEGLAVGLQPTTDSVLAIFLPVALHKGILAFALGLNLTQSKLSFNAIVRSNIIFAITSPLGIGIGILITDFAPDSGITDIVNGVIQAFACGTFLFVVFFEILPHEFMGRRRYASRLLKTLLLVLGFGTVSGLLFLDPDVVRPTPDIRATTTITP